MKRKFIAVLACVSAVFIIYTVGLAQEPRNLDIIKQELIEYHDSGRYMQQLMAVGQEALNYLKFRVNQNQQLSQPEKLAIVLDIDETALSNYANLRQLNFGGTREQFLSLQSLGHDPAISPTLTLYQYAISHNVKVFFITGRPETMRANTERNLRAVGYLQWSHIYFLPRNWSPAKSIGEFKAAIWRQLVKSDYKVVLNMGDQYSDLNSGHADMNYKLVNPYYFIE